MANYLVLDTLVDDFMTGAVLDSATDLPGADYARLVALGAVRLLLPGEVAAAIEAQPARRHVQDENAPAVEVP